MIIAHPARAGPREATAKKSQFLCLLSVAGLANSAPRIQVSDLTHKYLSNGPIRFLELHVRVIKNY